MVFGRSRRRRREVDALEQYVEGAPTAENAVRIFAGEWSSRLPGIEGGGDAELFEDDRITFADRCFGGFEGKRVLELGPLEAAHTHMMHARGAQEIISVEANARAYLKCLVVKEIFGLGRARFLLGDFNAYLDATDARFDVAVASGVLYHMMRPLELLERVARVSDRLLLWTHYFDAEVVSRRPEVAARFAGSEEVGGVRHHIYRYGGATSNLKFCGGSAPTSRWLERPAILGALEDLGFSEIEIANDDRDHPHGPAVTLACSKSTDGASLSAE